MVELTSYGKLLPETELPIKRTAPAALPAPAPVKLEIEDQLEDGHGPSFKRSKVAPAPYQQQWEGGMNMVSTQAMPYNLLNEPSPLGLRLKKSPSLLDLIQMKLSQANADVKTDTKSKDCSDDSGRKESRSCGASSALEKMKASNFPAKLLRIGTWEYESRYDGDLVAKCYFAKHKLVWEVLEGRLKSKMEIQWSDITALKACCPDDGPGTLQLVLARQPLFFRETNPQPRKHTLWQATSDFTEGQASMCRMHFLECGQGLLDKHFEKLIQCDQRLYSLSQEPDIILENPFFEPKCSVFDDQDESKRHAFDTMKDAYGSPIETYRESSSPCSGPLSSTNTEVRMPPIMSIQESHSPNRAMDAQMTQEMLNGTIEKLKSSHRWDHVSVPGLHPSMSVSQFLNQIGQSINEQLNMENPAKTGEALTDKNMLEEITQYLLSETSQISAADEQSLMSRVNSFCCLLQKDGGSFATLQSNNWNHSSLDGIDDAFLEKQQDPALETESDEDPVLEKPAANMVRMESFGDLLLTHLPRIASLPHILFNISEDGENQTSSTSS